jgi:hypothetical protein
MCEDDTAAVEQAALEDLTADRETFEARFPPEAFAGIAKALKVRPTPQNLSHLRRWLLPVFHYLYTYISGKEVTREEKIKHLKKLREAAKTLHSSMINFDDVWSLALLDGPLATDDFSDQFTATLQLLADTADAQIKKLDLRKSRRGRPTKYEPFRQFTRRLVSKYERLMKEPAGRPNWLKDSGVYGKKDPFPPFALAVWLCLQNHLPPEARRLIPPNENALGQELNKHWPEGCGLAGKN